MGFFAIIIPTLDERNILHSKNIFPYIDFIVNHNYRKLYG